MWVVAETPKAASDGAPTSPGFDNNSRPRSKVMTVRPLHFLARLEQAAAAAAVARSGSAGSPPRGRKIRRRLAVPAPLTDHGLQPQHGLFQAFAGHGTGGLDVPVAGGAQLLEAEGLLHPTGVQGLGEVLLVSQDQHRDSEGRRLAPGPHPASSAATASGSAGTGSRLTTALVDFLQLEFGLFQAILLGRIDHEYDGVGAPGIAPPQRPQLVLPAHVPDGEPLAFDLDLAIIIKMMKRV